MSATPLTATDKDALRTLRQLLRKRCWAVSTGGAAGGSVSLEFGKTKKRSVPLRNPKLDKVLREFEGEASLVVWCGWRLLDHQSVIATHDTPESKRISTLNRLVGHSVTKYWRDHVTNDLHLVFGGGYRLSTVNDFLPESSEAVLDNWQLHADGAILAANPQNELILEELS
jgi:hypothetical protein